MSVSPCKQKSLNAHEDGSDADEALDATQPSHIPTHMLKQGTPEWLQARIGNITASSAAVVICMGYVPQGSRMEQLARQQANRQQYFVYVRDRKEIKVPPNAAMDWGSTREDRAAAAYVALRAKDDLAMNIDNFDTAGLFMSKELHRVAASPDGLVPPWGEEDDGRGLVEIKCPFKKESWGYRLVKEDGTQYVPPSYIIQMTLQMLVIERRWCDFVTWTPCGMSVFKLCYDEELGQIVKEHCAAFIAAAERNDAEPPPLPSREIWRISNVVRRVKGTMTLRAHTPFKLTEDGVREWEAFANKWNVL